MKSIRVFDITFFSNREYTEPDELLTAQRTSLEYIQYMNDSVSVTVIKHFRKKTQSTLGKAKVFFFTGRNWFFYIPFRTLFLLRRQKPDIALVQGFGCPWQVLLLQLFLNRNTKLIIQHHGCSPFGYPKKIIQQWACKSADAFLFTSTQNALPWIRNGIIKQNEQCYELLEASVFLQKQPKEFCRKKRNLPATDIFLWVGRLNANKDPLSVLQGFSLYLSVNPEARLYMIYQTEELLIPIRQLINDDPLLHHSVSLVGKLPHQELSEWYSAADFYISGSHAEGSGYALIEAMACGCIPVVTNIPSFRKITDDGLYGILFEPDNPHSFAEALLKTRELNREQFSEKVLNHFQKELSFSAIAAKLYEIIQDLCNK